MLLLNRYTAVYFALLLVSSGCTLSGSGSALVHDENSKRVAEGERSTSFKRAEELEDLVAEIEIFASNYGLENLTANPPDSLEVRVWVGFGPNHTRGLVLSRNSNQILFLPVLGEHNRKVRLPKRLNSKVDKYEFWQMIEESPFLGLASDYQVGEVVEPAEDSEVVLVEVAKNKRYSAYKYARPCKNPSESARILVQMLKHLTATFDVPFFSCGNE